MPAEAFPPGDTIKEELEARDWSQNDLADILGRSARFVSEVISGKRSITTETAQGLADAFGTSAQFWMNLESAYRLWKAQAQSKESVSRRAKLYEHFPCIGAMANRGWIDKSHGTEALETEILSFFEVSRVDQAPMFLHAARKSSEYGALNRHMLAWLFYCRKLAQGAPVTGKFTHASLKRALAQLRQSLVAPEDTRRVAPTLAAAGVRFVIVKHLPKTKADGACFWLSESEPVVALSLRFDRIDWFWHTLLHELKHVLSGEGFHADSDMFKERPDGDLPGIEREANNFAARFLVPRPKLDSFIARTHPFYSKSKIVGFAERNGVHPGIVVGQLQFRREFTYGHHRSMLAKIRETVTRSTLSDGWGTPAPVG